MKKLIFFFFLFYSLFISAQICDPNYNSLYFDGSTYAALSNDNDLNATEKITVEAWIKPTQWGLNSSNGSIVCKHGWTLGEEGFVLRAGGNGELSFNIAGLDDHGVYSGWQEVVSNPGAIPLNTWTHVAGTYDGKKLRIYINGSQAGILNFKGSIVPAVSYNLKIGKIADNGTSSGRFWNGYIDEVRIWKTTRNASQISSGMNEHVDASTANDLAGYWRFNDGSLNTITDLGSGNNTGTVSGATWCVDVPFTNGIPKPILTELNGNLISVSLTGNQWNFNGIPIPGETGITCSPLLNGTYSLTVTDVLGCTATSDLIEVMSVGVVENFNEIFISYYISEGKLFFKNVPEEFRKSKIEIADIKGRKVFNDDNIQNEIDLNSFAAGLYFLIIRSEKSVFNAKIFVN